MNKFLSNEERKELLSELRLEKSRKYADRIRVILLLDEGQTYKNIAKFLFIDEGTIANYRKRYKAGGLKSLIEDLFKGKKSFISDQQLEDLKVHLSENLYNRTFDISKYIEDEFKVTYSISGLTKLLYRLGFSYKRPKSIVSKTSRELQEKFVEEYNKLKDGNARVYFGDSTHPRFDTVVHYGWIKRNSDFTLLRQPNSTRKGVNINGAVCLDDLDIILKQEEKIDKHSMCRLIDEIYKKNEQRGRKEYDKIFLVLDNASYNRSYYVQNYAKKYNIEVIYIPPYSPNLNPIERLWKYFKKITLYNQYFPNFTQFTKAIDRFFDEIEGHKYNLSSLLNDRFPIMGT